MIVLSNVRSERRINEHFLTHAVELGQMTTRDFICSVCKGTITVEYEPAPAPPTTAPIPDYQFVFHCEDAEPQFVPGKVIRLLLHGNDGQMFEVKPSISDGVD